MKNRHLLSFLSLILVGFGIFGCQESTPAEESSKKAPLIEGTAEPLLTGEIDSTEAHTRVQKYIDIYGTTGMQRLVGDEDEVILPRFFTVNSEDFSTFIADKDSIVFASLNVNTPEESTATVSNLIFHENRPNSNGTLTTLPDSLVDFCIACPINCDGVYYPVSPIDTADARRRVLRYNEIYGLQVGTERYMKGSGTNRDSVLIPRYYSFNKSDIEGILAALKKDRLKTFYVSVGATPQNENGNDVPNTYVSDLIFHIKKPQANGMLTSASDQFFDITRPCPRACGNE